MELLFKEAFAKLREEKGKSYALRSNNVLIEIVQEEVKQGLITIAHDVNHRVNSVHTNAGVIGYVLDVGEGYYDDETKETISLDIKPGDIVLLPRYSVQLFSTFPGLNRIVNDKIGLTIDSEIKMIFKGQEGYENAKKALNN